LIDLIDSTSIIFIELAKRSLTFLQQVRYKKIYFMGKKIRKKQETANTGQEDKASSKC
jgi:hypothetical protein